ITSAPADALGLGRAGRLAPGAVADLAAWAGEPDDLGAKGWPDAPFALFIGGEPVTQ
ncbi:amidohydrolase family protein, partial [bacterium]|nr:amidohydrolase family protein [bacterium]